MLRLDLVVIISGMLRLDLRGGCNSRRTVALVKLAGLGPEDNYMFTNMGVDIGMWRDMHMDMYMTMWIDIRMDMCTRVCMDI